MHQISESLTSNNIDSKQDPASSDERSEAKHEPNEQPDTSAWK